MKSKLIILFMLTLTIVTCGQVAAQDWSVLTAYDRDTIHLYYSFWGNGYVKDGEIRSLGRFNSNLAMEMVSSKYALEEMEKARKYLIANTITTTAATAIQIASIAIYIWNRDYVSKPGYEITLISLNFTVGILTTIFSRNAEAATNRAVWLYNRDVMLDQDDR